MHTCHPITKLRTYQISVLWKSQESNRCVSQQKKGKVFCGLNSDIYQNSGGKPLDGCCCYQPKTDIGWSHRVTRVNYFLIIKMCQHTLPSDYLNHSICYYFIIFIGVAFFDSLNWGHVHKVEFLVIIRWLNTEYGYQNRNVKDSIPFSKKI